MAVRVYLERGKKRVFAAAADWPGWARSGRDEHAAMEALEAYRDRYAASLGLAVPPGELDVVERVTGNATTDFGAPGVVPQLDGETWPAREAQRQIELLQSCWAYLDEVVATAPELLRKGPRGGGRDRDAVVEHVVRAEAAYARQIGLRHKEPALDDVAAITALRNDLVAALPAVTGTKWPASYAVRRMAWHVLDHAWEIEDKSGG